MRIRETNNPEKLSAKANEPVPINAINKKEETIFFGPYVSNKYPRGICIHANPRKYPPANKPKSAANKLNSEVKIGESVAVIALNKHDKKYPKANTKKTITACFLCKI